MVTTCPARGYGLDFESRENSASDEICPCCGIQFCYDAVAMTPDDMLHTNDGGRIGYRQVLPGSTSRVGRRDGIPAASEAHVQLTRAAFGR
jgi:hypothetical protein